MEIRIWYLVKYIRLSNPPKKILMKVKYTKGILKYLISEV